MKNYNIPAGELRERVELRSRTVATDEVGQQDITWTLVSTVWAKRVPARAEERFEAAQMRSEVVERFFIRARSDVDATWRLVWVSGNGTPAYDVVGVTPLPGRAFTELLCAQGRKDGR